MPTDTPQIEFKSKTNALQEMPREETSVGGSLLTKFQNKQKSMAQPQFSPSEIRARSKTQIAEYWAMSTLAEDAMRLVDKSDNVDLVRETIAALIAAKTECRDNRLNDSKPFKDLVKEVENIYNDVETILANSLTELRRKIAQHLPNADIDWEVSDFSIQKLDWNVLGPYLTPVSVLAAARKHLAATGRRDLSGVEYRALAKM